MSEVKLISGIGIDYTQLHSLLAIQNWQQADKETARLILKAANKKNSNILKNDEIATFPCEDLQIIDQLWMHYSQGHFGFSVQASLWDEILKINADFNSFRILASKVGWILDETEIFLNFETKLYMQTWLNFSTKLDMETLPKGHFPRWGFGFMSIGEEVTWAPGTMGLAMLSANVTICLYVTGPRVDYILKRNYESKTIPPLESLFSRIKTCDLVNITAHALPTFKQRLQQSSELQAAINKISTTSEINQLDTEIERLEQKDYYTPKTKRKFNKQIITSIAQRQGQPLFRKDLLEAYSYRCAVSGCDAQQALEAAHIIPYCETENNDISNGLLLRADLHTLFDLNLIAIDPRTMKIYIAPNLVGTYYEQELQNKSLRLPINKLYFPSTAALEERRQHCDWYSLYR